MPDGRVSPRGNKAGPAADLVAVRANPDAAVERQRIRDADRGLGSERLLVVIETDIRAERKVFTVRDRNAAHGNRDGDAFGILIDLLEGFIDAAGQCGIARIDVVFVGRIGASHRTRDVLHAIAAHVGPALPPPPSRRRGRH